MLVHAMRIQDWTWFSLHATKNQENSLLSFDESNFGVLRIGTPKRLFLEDCCASPLLGA